MKGAPMVVIAKHLGHADDRMVQKHYAHFAPSFVADTIRANLPLLGIGKETSVVGLKAKR